MQIVAEYAGLGIGVWLALQFLLAVNSCWFGLGILRVGLWAGGV